MTLCYHIFISLVIGRILGRKKYDYHEMKVCGTMLSHFISLVIGRILGRKYDYREMKVCDTMLSHFYGLLGSVFSHVFQT